MRALGLARLGVPADDSDATTASFRDALGLGVEREEGDFAILRLPSGEVVEVFGPTRRRSEAFSAGTVVGLRVDSVRRTREEMEARGTESIGPVHEGDTGSTWSHFRGPGGRIYEIVQG